MTNGISLEALNNLEDRGSKVIVVLNDNEMSISENVGALSRLLGRVLTDTRYNRIKAAAEQAGHRLHMTPLRRIYHRLEQAVKSLWLRNSFFEEFGLRYVGPIDGHDFRALESAFCSAREDKRSILIHVATQKGRGYGPAEREPSRWHGVGAFEAEGGIPAAGVTGYAQVCGETLAALAEENPAVMAITAAMCCGTGLEPFAARHPARFFDVGICEAHAVVFAAGLAAAGYRPVFAVYATFLQRAIDCVMHDICLQNLPVVLCVDRAGVVGSDGPTHHGIYDLPMLRCLPNLTIAQPRDTAELVGLLRTALTLAGPLAIRYPRDAPAACGLPPGCAEPLPVGRAEVVREACGAEAGPLVWLWAIGDMVALANDSARRLADAGVRAGVVNARFVKPLDAALLAEQAAAGTRLFVTLENGVLAGGFGSAEREALAEQGSNVPVRAFGWPDRFVGQGTTRELLEDGGLTPDAVAEAVAGALTRGSAEGVWAARGEPGVAS